MISRQGFRAATPLLWPLICLTLCCVSAQAATPRVVASIKPLQLIALALTDGVSTPQVVMAPGQDPHHMSLRPSERQALEQADLVLWVGPALEQPLVKVVAAAKVPVITAQSLAGITLLQKAGVTDPHLWLSTANARVIAAALLVQLQQLDASHVAQYQANAARFTTQLAALDDELAALSQPLQQQPWAVSHQAFGYLSKQLHLQEPLALTDSSNAAPGVQRVVQLREQLAQQHVQCLVTEPSENHQQLDSMLSGSKLRIVAADVLGSAEPLAADGYAKMLKQVGTAIGQCMSGGSHE